MIRINRTPWSFQAVTAAGAPIRTFDNAEAAAGWAEDQADNWPGCRVERVRVATTVETIFQHQLQQEKAA